MRGPAVPGSVFALARPREFLLQCPALLVALSPPELRKFLRTSTE